MFGTGMNSNKHNSDSNILKHGVLFDAAFHDFPHALVLIDNKGKIIDVNEHLHEWLGYDPAEIVNTHLTQLPFFSTMSKGIAISKFAQRLTGAKIDPYDLEMIAKDGSIKIGSISAILLRDENKNVVADFVVISDNTEKNKTAKLERLTSLMLNREAQMAKLKKYVRDNKDHSLVEKFITRNDEPENKLNAEFSDGEIPEILSPTKSFLTNVSKSTKAQVVIGVILGCYVSVLALVSFSHSLWLALMIAILLTFLLGMYKWLFIDSGFTRSVDNRELVSDAFLNLLEDLKDEKNYESEQSQSVLENISEMIVVTNEMGKIEYLNTAFKKVWGKEYNSLLNKDFAEQVKLYTFKGIELPVERRSDAAALTQGEEDLQGTLLLPNGKYIAYEMSVAPIRINDRFHGVVRIIHDVTKDHELQQQKDDFFSIASHELRTPLTVVAGNIDMILQGYGKSKITDFDKQLLDDVSIATDRLIGMVNDFLNVSRLDQGRLHVTFSDVDAHQVTQKVVQELQSLVSEKGIGLEYVLEDATLKSKKIHVDDGLFKEILINLIGNSVKFTNKGKITVSQRIEGKNLITTVTDTGIGIAEDKQELLFHRFQQAMNRTMSRESGGTGLGLYISKAFAKVMGGDLKLVNTEEGKGSVFAVTLPLS